MNESETYIASCIHTWAHSGFYTRDEANEFLCDILENDVNEKNMRDLIESEFTAKEALESEWPPITDCDKLDMVFAELNSDMIISIQNAGYTMSDGLDDVGEVHSRKPHGTYAGYCFYHGQDLDRAIATGELMIAFGDMKDTPDGKKTIANKILAAMERHGIRAIWEGNVNNRIKIPKIQWQRRYHV